MRQAQNSWPLVTAMLALVSVTLIVPLAFVSDGGGDPAPLLVRQPYIQNATATSIEIMWKTDTGGTSVVRYGATTAYGSEVAGDAGRPSIGLGTTPTPSQASFIHHVTISGLQPDTRYRYQVLTNGSALTPVDADYFFDTAPPSGSTAPFTFAAMGDIGNASSSEQRVADLVSLLNPDIYLGLGDIVYNYNELLQDTSLFGPNAAVFRNVTWYPTCGNHDDSQCYVLVDNHGLPNNSPFMTNPTATLRRPVYSFDYGNAHFVSLDSNLFGSAGAQQIQWAQADLANSTATWKIVYWHYNAWSTGSHNSFSGDAPGMNLANFAIQNDVDVALWGHSHTYERFSVFQGVQFFTSGNGGQKGPTLCVDHFNDPSGAGPRCLAGELENEAGVLLGSVAGNQIKFCQWNEFGSSQDGFTLTKGGAVADQACPPPAPIPTPSASPTPGATATPTPIPTPTATSTPTATLSPTPTPTATASPAPTPTATTPPTATTTPTVIPSPTPSPTVAPTPTPTPTPAVSPTPVAKDTPSPSPTLSPTPTASPTEEPTRTASPSPTPTPTASPTPEASDTPTPTLTPTATATPSASPTEEPTPTPLPSPTSTPTASPTPEASGTASATPTPTTTATPASPTEEPPTPTPTPTASPTPEASAAPTPTPTPDPDTDSDGDGYTTGDEVLIGTHDGHPCGIAGWPSNLTDGGLSANKLDISDIVSFIGPVRLLDSSPGPGSLYNARWDLAPGPNPPFADHINIIDLTTLMSGPAGSPAYPPMFGGLRAFGRECPWAP